MFYGFMKLLCTLLILLAIISFPAVFSGFGIPPFLVGSVGALLIARFYLKGHPKSEE